MKEGACPDSDEEIVRPDRQARKVVLASYKRLLGNRLAPRSVLKANIKRMRFSLLPGSGVNDPGTTDRPLQIIVKPLQSFCPGCPRLF